MSDANTIGELIRERRLARGLSLGQLATAIGRTAATVRSWERGQHLPAVDVVERLATSLGVEQSRLEDLMFQDPPSLTVVSDDADDDATPSAATSASGEASIETSEGAGDDETSEAGIVESSPAAATLAEASFAAASADDLGVMPRIQIQRPVAADGPGRSEPAADDAAGLGTPDDSAAPAADLDLDDPTVEDPMLIAEVASVIEAERASVAVPEVEAPAVEVPDPDLVDEPTEAIGPPITLPEPTETGHVGVAVRAEMLQDPEVPAFLAPLRSLFDPHKKWLYWVRGSLTVVAMLVMLLVLAWAAGELFDGIGAVLDTIESTDTVSSSLVPLN